MHNPGSYRSLEQFNEEEKFFNESFASVIEGDYVLNYLNDGDILQTRPLHNPNMFGQGLPEMQSFPSFNESNKALDIGHRQNGKPDRHDIWQMDNGSEGRGQYGQQNYKVENSDEFDGNVKTKKYKTNKETEVKVLAETPSRIKSNIKNTYINKINSLITEEKPNVKSRGKGHRQDSLRRDDSDGSSTIALSRTGSKKIKPSNVLRSEELEKLDVKLAKNRESARNSRIRKKVYIDLLEKTVDKLQKELSDTKKQLEAFTSSASKVNFQPKPVNNLYTAKQQLFERLEKMVSTKSDDSEISFLIDSLRLRFGASGKERVDVVNFMFKQVLEFLVPVHMKYILSAASQGKDLFTMIDNVPSTAHSSELNSPPGGPTEYWTGLGFQVNLSENQKKHMIKYKKKLMTEKQKFEGIIHNLNKVRKSVLKQANSLQTVVDDFRNYLSPTQTAKLLLSLEKEKDRKEFSAEKLWHAVTLKKENQDDESEVSDNFLDPEEGDGQGKDGDDDFEEEQ